VSDWLRWLLIAVAVLTAVALLVGRRRPRFSWLRLPDLHGRGPIFLSVLAWLLVAVFVALGTAGGLLWFLGWPHLPTAAVFDVTQLLDLLKIALSVVAGFGGVVLLAVNYRKQRVTENEHALAVEKAERETVQGFNERLGTAAAQLAHESPAVRLTGVYALAGLADDWVGKRQVCVDVLCGYLRLQPEVMKPGEAEVRRAILRMIRDRLGPGGGWRRSPVDFDFTGVTFDDADFAELRFAGTVVLDRADFLGETTSFAGTVFVGGLSCHGTRFVADRTTFARAWFTGRTEFVGAEFAGRELRFRGWEVAGGPVDFYRCRFLAEQLDFSSLGLRTGLVRFGKIDFADITLDLRNVVSSWDGDGGFARLTFEDVRFVRCRLDLEMHSSRDRMIWFVDSVLDTVTVAVEELEELKPWLTATEPWLTFRDVELRGGTVVPERYLRNLGAVVPRASSESRPGTPAPEA
jgi:hypothetical protein